MGDSKKTLVLGASPNPERYSHKAVLALTKNGHEVVAIGSREGFIGAIDIVTGHEIPKDIHTITVYMNASNQAKWNNFMLQCQPKRIIFNPGAENDTLRAIAQSEGIEVLDACTLVLLATGSY